MSIVSDAMKYPRLALGLRSYVRGTITLEESKRVISGRLRDRQRSFLALVEKGVFGNPRSPYLKLLKAAGCELGDIEALVGQLGVEPTLSRLLEKGVYISWEEFKGKKGVVRNGRAFEVRESDFDNPFLPGSYHVRSSGTRSAGTRTIFDLDHQLDKNYYNLPVLAASGAIDAPMGLWLPGLPSIAGIGSLLHQWKVDKPVAKWFSPTDDRQVRASLRDRLATLYIIYGARLWGARLARPEYVGLDDAATVARWMAETRQRFGGCCLSCMVSPAVKVCQAAIENQLDIRDTTFFLAGEPLTEAKRRVIESTGARAVPRYYITEVGFIGCGCKEGSSGDDIHVFDDSVAIVQQPRQVEHSDIKVDALLFSTLLPSAPKLMLNVESDDYGVMETRDCGCLLGELGFNRHLHDIRSFAKLTGSGMTILGSDFVRILEEVLPAKYGGAPTDYQLVEEEDTEGLTRLYLVISPAVGELDDEAVAATVLEALRRDAEGGKLAAALWSQASTIQVRRTHPVSSNGKITALHLAKRS